jgi:imidazole glycerol-phosphate synthase subunit HisH
LSPNDVVIIASGGANIASLQFALQRLGAKSAVSSDPQRIREASHVILPGVGAAADAMQRLKQRQLDTVIPTLQQPVLGICLGMQLLFEASDEGAARCLGILPGRAVRFAPAPGRCVPHMGWNSLTIERTGPLLEGVQQGDYVYFVHSYALCVSSATLASCWYGEAFSACVQWQNFYGMQFHPERSAKTGARLLRNFVEL